jgi:Homeodomain-like domain
MDDTPCRRFFLEPTQPLHRRYAALQASFVEGLSPQAIAERFDVTYHTVRSWVPDFRAQCRAGHIPPFSLNRAEADRRPEGPRGHQRGRKSRPRPTAGKSAWSPDSGCAPGSRGCSCPCRC